MHRLFLIPLLVSLVACGNPTPPPPVDQSIPPDLQVIDARISDGNGGGDATVIDGSSDATVIDSGSSDAAVIDSGSSDATVIDGGTGDGGGPCVGRADGSACDDGNACTQSDTCQRGVCTGANPVVCTALDACHVVGTCNPLTGACTNPNATNGTSCNDNNACTQTDTCQSGSCTGSNSVVCNVQDQCHTVGACDPVTGQCSNPNAADGTRCDDNNACTQSDTCQSGSCTGSNPVVCNALDQCHVAGTCNPANGQCSDPNAQNGTSCNDGNSCTQTDTCQSGSCTGSNPVVCNALDQCHVAGTCNPANGQCSNPNAENGTSCSDGNSCTQTDTCQSGSCTGSNPVVCNALDQCHVAGTCDPANGQCSDPNAQNGASCNDGNSCTQTDTCQSGSCTGSNPIVCNALDQCHVAGACNPANGQCSNPNAADGTGCTDGDFCTQTDTCQSGSCTGGNPVLCAALDQCHVAGVCNPLTGICSDPAAADGTDCDDSDLCTQTDTCLLGVCTGSDPIGCNALDQCHVAGTCDPATGACSDPPAADGTDCNDSNACTQTDTCQSGSCTGANPVVCTPLNQCHAAGTCDTGTGACSNPNVMDGSTCNENGGLACEAGICVPPPTVNATSPADGVAMLDARISNTITVTFSRAMNPATLTAQTAVGTCSGSVQVSFNNFATCIAFSAAAPVVSNGNTTASLTPAPGLLVNRTYQIRVTTAATSAVGLPLASQYNQTTGFTTNSPTRPNLCDGSLVISQIYGGGGNSGALYTNDFVELHNRGTTTVSLAGLSLQYVSATGSGTWNALPLDNTKSIMPGSYYLIQLAAGATSSNQLPSPIDQSDTRPPAQQIALGATAGKLALMNTTAAISGACPPTNGTTIDFVAYGITATATCTEALGVTPAPSNSTAVFRLQAGCADVNNNASDFPTATAPAPRNSATAPNICSCLVQNESNNVLTEVNYCDVQSPLSLNVAAGSNQTVYGRIFHTGVTEAAGGNANVRAQLGYGPRTANPQYQSGWIWTNGTFSSQFGNDDEYQASLTAPAAGSYGYVYRFSLDQGVSWTVCDQNSGDFGAGSNAGFEFLLADIPQLTTF